MEVSGQKCLFACRKVFFYRSNVALILLLVSFPLVHVTPFLFYRSRTGRKTRPPSCMLMEVQVDALTPFQYLTAWDNTTTSHYRYSPQTPFGPKSEVPSPWNAILEPQEESTQPWTYQEDRQVALVELHNVTQGSFGAQMEVTAPPRIHAPVQRGGLDLIVELPSVIWVTSNRTRIRSSMGSIQNQSWLLSSPLWDAMYFPGLIHLLVTPIQTLRHGPNDSSMQA